jgi:hypothetical protein
VFIILPLFFHYWTGEDIFNIYNFQCLLYFLKISYYFCHTLLFSTELRIMRFVIVLQSSYCFSYVTKGRTFLDNVQNCDDCVNIPSSKLWLSVFQILKLCHTKINDKWKPSSCLVLKNMTFRRIDWDGVQFLKCHILNKTQDDVKCQELW